ncbi:MAG: hypothetical protein IPP09_08550 [Elusimicrobia bacterium]|nr:hypothetical protein [Elusimicrobiota bacterium]MBK7544734.1 hypothetical protein [Elusimicrobiota bacterium]MBK9923198.1 hypothetical protein [Elusimicrobiota bacterium]
MASGFPGDDSRGRYPSGRDKDEARRRCPSIRRDDEDGRRDHVGVWLWIPSRRDMAAGAVPANDDAATQGRRRGGMSDGQRDAAALSILSSHFASDDDAAM